MRGKWLPDGISELGGQKVIIKDGTARLESGNLAGSVLKFNDALRNISNWLDLSLIDLSRISSLNAAINLGISDAKGSIAIGKDADLVMLDKDFNVLKPWLEVRCYMKVKVFDNSALLYDYLCEKVISKIKENPNITLGLPTGSTPIPLYERLIQAYIDHKVDFANVTSINLDEYVGLGPTHNQSYRYFMDNTLFDHININKANTFVPNGMAKDLKQECENYHNLLVLKK